MLSFKQFISEGIEDRGIFKAIFLCGSPGAGKSTARVKIDDPKISPRVINTDDAYEFLVGKHKMHFSTDEEAELSWLFLKDKSKVLTKDRLALYLNGALPLIVDGTSSNPSSLLLRVGILESLGYDVGMIYIETNVETSLLNVEDRARKEGRKVPEAAVRKMHAETEHLAEYYKSKFDFYLKIKNNRGELTNEVVIDAYKKAKSFFEAEVQNPIGKKAIDTLKHYKEKVLIPNILDKSELAKKVDGWYRK